MAETRIEYIYITRVVNEDRKKYAFGITEKSETVYVPGRVVEDFDLTEDDVGTRNKVAILSDSNQSANWIVATLLIEDSAEVNRLKALLDEHGIEYDE